jgi:hypothetical protein
VLVLEVKVPSQLFASPPLALPDPEMAEEGADVLDEPGGAADA